MSIADDYMQYWKSRDQIKYSSLDHDSNRIIMTTRYHIQNIVVKTKNVQHYVYLPVHAQPSTDVST